MYNLLHLPGRHFVHLAVSLTIILTLAACGMGTGRTTPVSPTAAAVQPEAAGMSPTIEAAEAKIAPADPTLAPTEIMPVEPVSTLDPQVQAELDEFLNTVYGGEPFQGAILVAREGQILIAQGYGMANRTDGTPNQVTTRFRLGSVTKPFTAIAVLMLHNEGKLDVNDPVCDFLVPCPAGWAPITLHHLLSHTSGIHDLTRLPDYPIFKVKEATPLETLARFSDLPLDFAPGERWEYSNSNYIVLGIVIEQASGQRYELFIEDRILIPLGMNDTGYEHTSDSLAVGYTPDGSPAEFIDMSLPFAAGGLYSTVGDLYKLDRALYTDQLLPEHLRNQMFTAKAKIDPNDPSLGYGYGWVIAEGPTGKIVSHSGGIEGFTSAFVRSIDTGGVIIVLGNVEGRNPGQVADGIARIVFGAQ